jgi:hypothetical protein
VPLPPRPLARRLLALVTLAACAHGQRPVAGAVEEVSIGSVAVALRYAPVDADEAAQVRRALRAAVPLAERWGPLPANLTITVHPSHDALEGAARSPGLWWLRAWSRRGRVDPQSPRTWTGGAASDAHLTQLLAHELTHCVLFEAIGGDRPTGVGIPAWFREGMATTNSGERFVHAHPDALGAFLANDAFHGETAPFAYAAANEAFHALERRHGRARIQEILGRVRGGAGFPDAFHDALGVSLRAFEADPHALLARAPNAG